MPPWTGTSAREVACLISKSAVDQDFNSTSGSNSSILAFSVQRLAFSLIALPEKSALQSRFEPSSCQPMLAAQVDAEAGMRIAQLGGRVLSGGKLDRSGGRAPFRPRGRRRHHRPHEIWANRVRRKYSGVGNKIHLCLVVNAKAGGCSENCSFCAQSAAYQNGFAPLRLCGPRSPVREAADEAGRHGVTAVGLVAAWKERLNEGPDARRGLPADRGTGPARAKRGPTPRSGSSKRRRSPTASSRPGSSVTATISRARGGFSPSTARATPLTSGSRPSAT